MQETIQRLTNSIRRKVRKDRKLSKKDIAVMVSFGMAAMVLIGVTGYDPSLLKLNQLQKHDEVKMAELSKLAGPQQDIEGTGDSLFQKRKDSTRKGLDKDSMMRGIKSPIDAAKLPDTMPSFNFPSTASRGSVESREAMLSAATDVYNRHMELSAAIGSILSPNFEITEQASAPEAGTSRFKTVYDFSSGATPMERFELMSIVKVGQLKGLNTPQQVLDSLIEEGKDINVIESGDGWLIYDYTGSNGYQIGKIIVEGKAIHILGYVNLTTDDMPNALKDGWVNDLRAL